MVSPLESLRAALVDNGLTGTVIPATDPHQSEYVPKMWQRRAYISGFTGSAGDLAVTLDDAALWTDSRYFLQAENTLRNTGIQLCRQGETETPTIAQWLGQRLQAGAIIGVDPHVFSQKSYGKLKGELRKQGIALKATDTNLVDAVWKQRPAFPSGPITVWPEAFSGKSVDTKLSELRSEMARYAATHHVITPLDAIAWLFNIRGSDVPYNPVAIAYAVVGMESARLFVSSNQITQPLREHLDGYATIEPYESFTTHLKSINKAESRVLLDPDTTSRWTVNHFADRERIVYRKSPLSLMKAVKNGTELRGAESAHIRDGVAMVKFLCWLDKAVARETVTEISAANRLADFRREGDRFVSESFGTISAFGENGAIVHYEANDSTNKVLTPDNLYLIDSGGQYLDGTTDITRTVALGPPTDEQRDCFTRVLKGHISLATTSFPAGTTGNQLDTIARKPLWDVGLNYGHGTGHGVGAYLNVHEGPHAISYYRGFGVPIKEGMITSIEPGYYQEGCFGIRIENLVKVVENRSLARNASPYLTFAPLTLCPIDKSLIQPALLTQQERDYLDAYHDTVKRTLGPLLSFEPLEWLEDATSRLGEG